MQDFLNSLFAIQIAEGTTVGDILTVEWMLGALGNLVLALVILLAGFTVAGFVKRRITGFADRSKHLDITTGSFLGNLARYAIMALTIVFVLQNFGLQTASLVALLGAAGLAIGLALQGVLGGVAAGVMLVIFRPFKVGDFIDVGGEMGTVKDISIFTTELARIDNVQIIIPNANVWGNTITNYSVYPTRRAEWTFGVSYGTNLADAERIIRQTIEADPRTMMDPAPFLQVNNLGDFSVDFLVRYWVASGDFWQYQADMKRQVKEALDAGGIEIPFPTRQVINQSE